MMHGIAVLLFFQLIGETLVFLSGLPVPGPVVGLVLLFLALQASRTLAPAFRAPVEQVADVLLANLGLLFVPAGVGIVSLSGLLREQGGAIAIVLVLSAIVTLAVTVWTFVLTRRLLARRGIR